MPCRALLMLLCLTATASAQEKSPAPNPNGETLRLPVTRDTCFPNVGAEANGNNGGAERLKVKSHQEMSLLDVDVAKLRGRVIRSATLHLHSTGEPPIKRLTVGTFAAEWVEGTAHDYTPQAGSSTFLHRRHPD